MGSLVSLGVASALKVGLNEATKPSGNLWANADTASGKVKAKRSWRHHEVAMVQLRVIKCHKDKYKYWCIFLNEWVPHAFDFFHRLCVAKILLLQVVVSNLTLESSADAAGVLSSVMVVIGRQG